MKKLAITKTPNTPLVEFDSGTGLFKIEGRSIPENPGEFYDHLEEWIVGYFEKPADTTVFELNLEYVNSGSSKYLLGLFRVLKEQYEKGNNIKINWYYEEDDEAIEGLGEHYRSTLNLPFYLVEYI